MVKSHELDAVFSALSDPTRRRIVERLARGPLTAGQIASRFTVSQPAISKHLKVLEESGLLARTVSGRVHHLRLVPKAMAPAETWLDRQRRFWEATLERLDILLSKENQ